MICHMMPAVWSLLYYDLAICYNDDCDIGVDGCPHRFCQQCIGQVREVAITIVFTLLVI